MCYNCYVIMRQNKGSEKKMKLKPKYIKYKYCNECNVHAPVDDVCSNVYLMKQFKNIFLCNYCVTKIQSWIGYKKDILGG